MTLSQDSAGVSYPPASPADQTGTQVEATPRPPVRRATAPDARGDQRATTGATPPDGVATGGEACPSPSPHGGGQARTSAQARVPGRDSAAREEGPAVLRPGGSSPAQAPASRPVRVKHLVQFSTGIASAEVAWRVVAEHGAENVILLTADTRAEDEDNWRFGREVANKLGCEWIILADGRTPMQVGRDRRCVPSNRMAVCSQILKRELLDRYRAEHFDPASTIVYLGYDWTELHRVEAAQKHWAPWVVKCPLIRPPHLWKLQILDLFRERRIEPPRLYDYGFQHANCGGACVRGGQAQWSLLLQVNRTRYLDWEAEEEASRELLGKDVSILRDRTGGTTASLSLRAFRERIERQPGMFDTGDWGACGCFMDGNAAETTDGAA